MITSTKEKRQIVKSVEEVRHPKRQTMEAKMEFLSKVPKKKSEGQKKIDEVKFFYEQDPKKIRILEILKAKIASEIFHSRSPSPTRSQEQSQPHLSVKPLNLLIKEIAKGTKNFKKKNQELVDVKGRLRIKTPEGSKPLSRNSPEPPSPILKKQISDYQKLQQSPLKSKALFHIRRSTTAIVSDHNFTRQGYLQTSSNCESPIKMMQFVTENNSPVTSQTSLTKIKSYNYFDDEEIRHHIRERHQANQAQRGGNIGKYDYTLKSVPIVDAEENEEAVFSIGPFERSPSSPQNEEGNFTKFLSKSNNNSPTRLTPLMTPTNSQLRKTKEWRKKVFQKVPLRSRDGVITPMLSVSLMPSESPTHMK